MTTPTKEELLALAETQVNSAIKCLDVMAGLPENTTSGTHRVLVESILNAAILHCTIMQLEALK